MPLLYTDSIQSNNHAPCTNPSIYLQLQPLKASASKEGATALYNAIQSGNNETNDS